MIKNTHDFDKIVGKYVNLREANIEDSTFILKLRTNEKLSKYVSKISSDLQKQIDYLNKYKSLENEWYFIVENKKEEPLGTIRIYPYPDYPEYPNYSEVGNLGTGSWLMNEGSSPLESIESDYLVKDFFFNILNNNYTPMEINKENKTVIAFQNKWGNKMVGDIGHSYTYRLYKDDYIKNKTYFARFLYGL
jgi:hypothetical protein